MLKNIYIVSVNVNGNIPKIRLFFEKKSAINFAFNEATAIFSSNITYSDTGNYILTNKKNKTTITTHYTSDLMEKKDGILLECSSKIICKKPQCIDLNDSGVLSEDSCTTDGEYSENIDEN